MEEQKVNVGDHVAMQCETSSLDPNSAMQEILEMIRNTGIKFRANRDTTVTAFVLCHRYLNQVKEVDDQWMRMTHMIAATCFFTSQRVNDDQNFNLNDIVNFFHTMANPDTKLLDENGPRSEQLRRSITDFEVYLLQAIQFNLKVEMPHFFLLNYLRDLSRVSVSPAEKIATFCEGAHTLLSDFYFNPSCIRYLAKNIAVAIVVLMMKSWPIQLAEGVPSKPDDLIDYLTDSTCDKSLISQIEKEIVNTFSQPFVLN